MLCCRPEETAHDIIALYDCYDAIDIGIFFHKDNHSIGIMAFVTVSSVLLVQELRSANSAVSHDHRHRKQPI